MQSIDAVIERLQEASAGTDGPVSGWQLDPIYFDNRRVSREDLDRVSPDRPVGVIHASCHILNVNTKALELAGMLRPASTTRACRWAMTACRRASCSARMP